MLRNYLFDLPEMLGIGEFYLFCCFFMSCWCLCDPVSLVYDSCAP